LSLYGRGHFLTGVSGELGPALLVVHQRTAEVDIPALSGAATAVEAAAVMAAGAMVAGAAAAAEKHCKKRVLTGHHGYPAAGD
jgi:hypothetical protein